MNLNNWIGTGSHLSPLPGEAIFVCGQRRQEWGRDNNGVRFDPGGKHLKDISPPWSSKSILSSSLQRFSS